MVRVDAHHHLWRLDWPADSPWNYAWLDQPMLQDIRRDFMPEDLKPLIDRAGIDKTVIVQTQHHLAENEWALELAGEHDFLAGVVGWVDLASPKCEEQLEALRDHAKFCGIRHVTHDEPDEDFIIRPDVVNGLRILEKHRVPFDLLFYTPHLRHAPTLARQLPELPMVIDHLSKPLIRDRRMESWRTELREAAAFPNLYCKLSGMVTEADWQNWKPSDLKPYVEVAVEAFGPRRCMFGSDWPVCLLAAEYQQVHDTLAECVADLSDAEQSLIFGETAAMFYRLDV